MHLLLRAYISVASTMAAATSYASVARYDKPRHLQSNGVLQVDAGVTLIMYEGNFDIASLASIVTPLAKGEMVAFPSGGAPILSKYWRGTAARV